jgi:hypothetical protein
VTLLGPVHILWEEKKRENGREIQGERRRVGGRERKRERE